MIEVHERLEELLAKPVESAEGAERAREAAEALAAYLRAIERAEQVLGLGGDQVVPAPTRANGGLAGLSVEDAAERVLEEADVSLHVRDLAKRMKARGWRHPRSENPAPELLERQLAARLPAKPDRFRRVAPNTFALSRWQEGGQ